MAYRSGRKKRVMIACVTFETVKVTDPVRYYECSKVHIIHYTKETSDKKTMFSEFYDRVCEMISKPQVCRIRVCPSGPSPVFPSGC